MHRRYPFRKRHFAILHLNGYKINNPTLLARISHRELGDLLKGFGWTPHFVEGSDPDSMHQSMAVTVELRLRAAIILCRNLTVVKNQVCGLPIHYVLRTYLCASVGLGTTYSGKTVGGPLWTIV